MKELCRFVAGFYIVGYTQSLNTTFNSHKYKTSVNRSNMECRDSSQSCCNGGRLSLWISSISWFLAFHLRHCCNCTMYIRCSISKNVTVTLCLTLFSFPLSICYFRKCWRSYYTRCKRSCVFFFGTAISALHIEKWPGVSGVIDR